MNLFDISVKFPLQNTAIISEDDLSISYTELDNFSKFLKDKIPSRSLIFSLNKNTLGSLVGYYSFIKNKVVPLMLDAKMDIQLINSLIDCYKPEYLWLPKGDSTNFPKSNIICSLFDYSLIKLKNCYNQLLHEDLALLLTTSGSTGSPKVVKLTYQNIKSNTLSIIEYLSINQNERPITTLPMSYSFGLSIINSHLSSGATLLLTNKSLFEKEFWSFLKKEKATSLSGVPYTFDILKKLRFTRMDLPHLQTLTQAGGKMNKDLNNDFVEFCNVSKKRFFVMYGQTEATARMSYLPHEFALSKLGSIGFAIPNGRFSLINEAGEIIQESNTIGELVFEGPNVSMGYAECVNDLSNDDENKGRLITGDLAKRDLDGFYYIVGRKKRFLKIFGNRVNLDETERLLNDITTECACTGNDDKMIVFTTDNFKIDKIQHYISSKLGLHHSAFLIKHIESIPKNSAGKTIYSDLKI
tara:strand:- start:508 stop:1914 length:1407 start_codon:yes stop_codon:yes gene_type:complete